MAPQKDGIPEFPQNIQIIFQLCSSRGGGDEAEAPRRTGNNKGTAVGTASAQGNGLGRSVRVVGRDGKGRASGPGEAGRKYDLDGAILGGRDGCARAVVVPGVVDFTQQANDAFQRFADEGMNVVKSNGSWGLFLENAETLRKNQVNEFKGIR